jgi:hypothetical protein
MTEWGWECTSTEGYLDLRRHTMSNLQNWPKYNFSLHTIIKRPLIIHTWLSEVESVPPLKEYLDLMRHKTLNL